MTKFHVNHLGVPGPCRAKKNCPFGLSIDEHYPTKEEARAAYEKENSDSIIPSPKKLSQIERVENCVSIAELDQVSQSLKRPAKPVRPKSPVNIDQESIKKMSADLTMFMAEEEKYEEDMKDYRAAKGRVYLKAREILDEENFSVHVPSAIKEKVFDLAYERGHSYGLKRVADEHYDLAELAQTAFRAGRTDAY